MQAKQINFEDLKNLKYGDQIVMSDPFTKEETPCVLMSNIEDKSFYFISETGASLNINSQDVIDGFNVKLIDETHPKWNDVLSNHGKEIGSMLETFVDKDFGRVSEKDFKNMAETLPDIKFK